MPNSDSTNPWTIEETAFLVYVNEEATEDQIVEDELEGLCEAARVKVVGGMRQRIGKPHKGTYIGKGKLEELKLHIAETGAEVVVFDAELSGVQARNISEAVERKVIDRTQLILDIFARRARSREGQLQVELAQRLYMLPRLMSVYTKFERQRGGIGMRGPGEMKLEADRRLFRDRISKLENEIEEVKRHRQQQRQSRRKHPYPFATIVGYTSAGKSTLMNLLCQTDLLADAMPFATLDPTTRKVELEQGYAVFLTDTVGFIRKLPTHLIAAFRATLEETNEADFILHVVDLSVETWETQRDAVEDTLEALGALEQPTITVYNKIDALPSSESLRELIAATPNSVAISAKTGAGLADLKLLLIKKIKEHLGTVKALVPYQHAALVERCYDFGRVVVKDFREDGIYVEAEVVEEMRNQLMPYAVR